MFSASSNSNKAWNCGLSNKGINTAQNKMAVGKKTNDGAAAQQCLQGPVPFLLFSLCHFWQLVF